MLTKPIEQIPDCKNCVNNEQAGFYSHRKALDRLVKDYQTKHMNLIPISLIYFIWITEKAIYVISVVRCVDIH